MKTISSPGQIWSPSKTKTITHTHRGRIYCNSLFPVRHHRSWSKESSGCV